jgi:WD40 repeat protein
VYDTLQNKHLKYPTMTKNTDIFQDDMLIKLWDWDNKWACKQIFEGHMQYVMQTVFNPKDNNTFASASLDKTVKVKSHKNSPKFATKERSKKTQNWHNRNQKGV